MGTVPKAQELRIGNYLNHNHDGSPFIVSHHDIKIIAEWKLESQNLPKRITLTAEWLINFGFKSRIDSTITNWHIGINPITHDWLFHLVWINGFQFPFYQNGYFEIKYVDQLQNLYFAITNEELKLIKA